MIILIWRLLCSSHYLVLYVVVLCEIHVENGYESNDNNVARGDQKGGIQGGAHRTTGYLGERCRYDHPSGSVYTPSESLEKYIGRARG